MIRLSLTVALIVLAANACNCGGAVRACANTGDCRSGEICLNAADGSSTCVVGEGEGEGVGEGEGAEGEGGEGEGAEGEGAEGEGAEGEGEGEGAGPGCGNNVVDAGEQCDDGNDNDNDACSNACQNTSVTTSIVLGASALRELPLDGPRNVWGRLGAGVDVGTVFVDATSAIFWRPPSSPDYFRVDNFAPRSRATPVAPPAIGAVAATPDGFIIYFDSTLHQVFKLDPATGLTTAILGNGDDNSPTADPPNFTFASPFDVEVDGCRALDVDSAGTIYAAAQKRVVSLSANGVARVVAGTAVGATSGGTPAQLTSFAQVSGISVDFDESALLLAEFTNNHSEQARVVLADGTIEFFRGNGGHNCNNVALANNCEIRSSGIVSDGLGGYFANDFGFDATAQGLVHVDGTSQRIVTTLAPFSFVEGPLSLAIVEPGVVALGYGFAEGTVKLAHDDGTTEERLPVPERSSDRSPRFIDAAAARGSHLYVATFDDLFVVDEITRSVSHIINTSQLGPCATLAPLTFTFWDGLAVSLDDTEVYVAQTNNDRVCALDLSDNSVRILGSQSFLAPHQIAVRSDGIIVDGRGVMNTTTGVVTPFSPTVNVSDVDSDGSRSVCIKNAGGQKVSEVGTTSVGPDSAVALISGKAILVDGSQSLGALVLRTVEPMLIQTDATATATIVINRRGYQNGAATDAALEASSFDLVRFGDGAVGIVSQSSVRLLKDGVVTTLVGTDQFTEDGAFTSARLAKPVSVSCLNHVCVAADFATRTLRRFSFDTNRLERFAGEEELGLNGLKSVAVLSDTGTAVFSNVFGAKAVSIVDGTQTTLTLTGHPAALAAESGTSFFYVDSDVTGGDLHRFDTNGGADDDLGALGDEPHAIAYDVVENRVVLVTDDAVSAVLVDAAEGVLNVADLDAVVDGAGRGVAVDSFGNIYVATTKQLLQIRPDDTRLTLLDDGDVAGGAPVNGDCFAAVSIVDDDAVVADACTGAVIRVAIE